MTPRLFLCAIAAALLLSWPSPASAKSPASAPVTVYIVHTCDMHGHLLPDSHGRGGMARIAGFLDTVRAEHPGHVIYLDAGDISQGTFVSDVYRGRPMVAILNQMHPAAATVGNHEFDWGPKTMRTIEGWAHYPVVLANLVYARSGKTVFPPYRILNVAGVKLGVFGLLTPTTVKLSNAGDTAGYRFLDPIATARKVVPEMRRAGAQVIVALTHLGVKADTKLARADHSIDIIVGGHSHTDLARGLRVAHTEIVQAYCYTRCVGLLRLTYDPGTGKILSDSDYLVNVDPQAHLKRDPTVAAIVAAYEARVKPLRDKVICHLRGPLVKKHTRQHLDSTLGDVIADSLRRRTGADLGIYDSTGIFQSSLPAGPVTRGEVSKLLPYYDQVLELRMSGKDLMEIFKHGVRDQDRPLEVSGARLILNRATHHLTATIHGRPLDPRGSYTVAVINYMAHGGGGYTAFTRGKLVRRFGMGRRLFTDYLATAKVLSPPKTGRITVADR